MAPIGHSATAQAETAIRDTIQSLYNVMLHTSAYDAAGNHTSLDALIAEVRILSQALQEVNAVVENDNDGGRDAAPLTLDSTSTSTNHRNLPSVPRDLVQYVEAGRNPDIYTREFVELVRRTNQLRAGKRGAFAQFRDTLAGQIRSALPELGGDVDRIMEAVAETQGQETASNTRVSPDGSKATVVGDGETPAANAASAVAGPANLSASASPSAHLGSGSNQAGAGTLSGNSDAGSNATSAPTTIDMMGILPSTPQPISAAGGGATSGSATGGAATGEGAGSGAQDAMETS
ncbi:RNA polymerase II mediator complex subunit [Sporothrix stenoceras]|uniref:Mediator of RNA polymerase II transcription subunit 10 n=1 Tax=Sporothrix stenoceras TaxID=5173 RepID=A0ABR3Z0W2_9PEZI